MTMSYVPRSTKTNKSAQYVSTSNVITIIEQVPSVENDSLELRCTLEDTSSCSQKTRTKV
jgi:hypothetical protein